MLLNIGLIFTCFCWKYDTFAVTLLNSKVTWSTSFISESNAFNSSSVDFVSTDSLLASKVACTYLTESTLLLGPETTTLVLSKSTLSTLSLYTPVILTVIFFSSSMLFSKFITIVSDLNSVVTLSFTLALK